MTTAIASAGGIVCIGACALDLVMALERAPDEDERVTAQSATLAGGGPAATAAVTIRRLGLQVAFAGTVGDDEAGRLIHSGLRSAGVDVSFLRTKPGARSALSVGLIGTSTASRSLVAYQGDLPGMVVDEQLEAACRAAAWVHVDHAGYTAVAQLRERGVDTPISVDGGNALEHLDLSLVDLYVPSASELLRWTGLTLLPDAVEHALRAGPSAVVATRGADGSLAGSVIAPESPVDTNAIRGARRRTVTGHIWWHDQAAHPVRIDDGSTLGAGDVYHGALLTMLAIGETMREAMRDASVAAALACRGIDGRSAIPTLSEVRAATAATLATSVPR